MYNPKLCLFMVGVNFFTMTALVATAFKNEVQWYHPTMFMIALIGFIWNLSMFMNRTKP